MQRWLHAVALQGQALRVFDKKIFLLGCATKEYFFTKKPCIALCFAVLIAFLFSFSVFCFSCGKCFSQSVCASAQSKHCQTFIYKSMETAKIKIQVFNPTQESQPAVYVLSRGLNSGKVQNQPSANSYAIYAPSELLPLVKAAANILFQSHRLRPYLHGSVIEFVKIDVYRHLFFELWRSLSPDVIEKTAKQMQALEQYSANLETQLKKVVQLYRAIALSAFA